MSRVWKLAIPVAALVAVLGYAATSLAASDLDDMKPRETIVIDDGADQQRSQEGGRGRPGEKGGDDRGGDGRSGELDDDDDIDVIQPEVDDLDDDDGDDDDGDDDDQDDDDG
ncbi:hypothetical protein [Nocardioides sp.]|uniref:hypothetical protein n=1 Tax=Nocardioides sp. TaxID=35761 RepID=UPI002ED20E0E